MIEKYYLNGESLPTIPVPHDCVIKHIQIKDQSIEFGPRPYNGVN